MKPKPKKDPDLLKQEAEERRKKIEQARDFIAAETRIVPKHIVNGSYQLAVAWKRVAVEAIQVAKGSQLAKLEAACMALKSFHPTVS